MISAPGVSLTSLLSACAQEWAAALYNAKSPACNDYALFAEELKKTFDPPCSEVEVESQLYHLRQGKQSMCHFFSEFHIVATTLNWGNAALLSIFMESLTDDIWDKMAGHEASKTLDELWR